jgi:hypothetical protein
MITVPPVAAATFYPLVTVPGVSLRFTPGSIPSALRA